MYTIDKFYQYEQIINRSRFICSLYPIKDLEEALSLLNQIRKQYHDATHNCYSYILGDVGEITKSSDDKEPAQTAGVIIYDVLKKNELTNVLAVVTRYYGGTKLGAGGLIRAYSSSTSGAVREADLLEITKCLVLEITCDYPYGDIITRIFSEAKELSKSFTNVVVLKYLIKATNKDDLIEKVTSATKNSIKIEVIAETTQAFANGA